jgi:hypothetical protein
MLSYLVHAGLFFFSTPMGGDLAVLLAPLEYDQIRPGMTSAQVEEWLGPIQPRGTCTLYIQYGFGEGWRTWTETNLDWECRYGTLTVKHVNDQVTEKHFEVNAEGIKAAHSELLALAAFSSGQRLLRDWSMSALRPRP